MPEIIFCPSCRAEIEVSEALSAPLRDQLRKQFDAEQRKREKEYADRDAQLQQRGDDLQAKEANLDAEIKARLVAAKERMQYITDRHGGPAGLRSADPRRNMGGRLHIRP